jgi:putative lipase involved disintegration of autophagic bodies
MVNYKNCNDCKVHAGFYLDYVTLSKKIMSKVDELKGKYSVERIISTGHSLGASMSAIVGL